MRWITSWLAACVLLTLSTPASARLLRPKSSKARVHIVGLDHAVADLARSLAVSNLVRTALGVNRGNASSMDGATSLAPGAMRSSASAAASRAWMVDLVECENRVHKTLTKLADEYTDTHVPGVLQEACDHNNVYRSLGETQDRCHELFFALATEFSTGQDYQSWCRKVVVEESTAYRSRLARLNANPSWHDRKNKCSAQCPQVANVIQNLGMVAQIGMKRTYGPAGPEDVQLSNQLMAQLCDFQADTKCTVQHMGPQCEGMLKMIDVDKKMLSDVFDMCLVKRPCENVCIGVDERVVQWQRSVNKAQGDPTPEMVKPLCKSYTSVQECASKPACVTYFHYMGVRSDDLDRFGSICRLTADPCFAKLRSTCKKESDEWQKYIPEAGAGCPNAALSGVLAQDQSVQTLCCQRFESFGKCAGHQQCTSFLKASLAFQDTGLDGVIKTQCSKEWAGTFGASNGL